MTSAVETRVNDLYGSLAERGFVGVAAAVTGKQEHERAFSPPPAHKLHNHTPSHSISSLAGNPDIYDAVTGARSHKRLSLSPKNIGKAILARVVRAVRRGNLPFLIIFLTALVVFFGALAGIGYVDPDAATPQSSLQREFVVGEPVFDPSDAQLQREAEAAEQRALEESWVRKQRPNAGAWMKKQRNDQAVRFKYLQDGQAPRLPWEEAAEIEEEEERMLIVEEQEVSE